MARLVLVRLAVVLTAATGAALVALPAAQAVTVHRTLNDTRPVSAAPVSTTFPIEHFGVVADLPDAGSHLPDSGRVPYGEVRFHEHGAWTAWQPLDQAGAQAPGQFTAALVSVDRADGYQVRGLPALGRHWRAAAINTSDGPTEVTGYRPAGTAHAASTCRSRADWGADESISGWSRGDTQVYYPAQVLTVHHTAGSNDPNQDYAATVRAIYAYHVQTNGWSDIGYQYLVDGHGVVYEGRNAGHTSVSCLYGGGDGKDFAHQTGTDYVVTGAHVGGYNSGNVGIALMGCFEPTNACSGDTTPPAAAEQSAEQLIADLSTRHGLDPQGSTHYVNPVNGTTRDVATVSGHRDWEATACPGGKLYADLPAIRSAAASLMGGAPAPAPAPSDGGAVGETATAGTVSGSYTATRADDGDVETITEVSSGGKPSKRYATLTHTWLFDPVEATSFTVHATAAGESFHFDWSTDGSTYAPLGTLSGAATVTWALPSAVSGRVYVRVTDVDHTSQTAGSLAVDYLQFGTSTSTAPASTIQLTATGTKDRGVNTATLTWSGASGPVAVYRDGDVVATVDGTSYTDTLGKGSGQYAYKVCDSTTCSKNVTVIF